MVIQSSIGGPLSRSSLRDQVLEILRQRLVAGSLHPGEIYSTQAIAAELGVSGSPVREAMLTLVTQGLMAPVRNRGFRVVEITSQDREGIFELRLWLEVPAMARLACDNDRLKEAEREFRNMANSTVQSARAGDVAGFLSADRQFHLGLLDLLENSRLTAIIRELRDQTRLYGLERLRAQGSLIPAAEEHINILEALIGGDVELVRQLMTTHMSHVLGDWASESDDPSLRSR